MPTSAGTGSRATPQPQPSQIRTRASQVLDRVPMHEELVKMNKDSLKTAAQAHEYLEKQGYVPPDAKGGKATLSYTLLLLLHAAPPNVLPKGIRVVATLLESEEVGRTADTIVAAVMRKLDPVLELMEHTTDMEQEAIGDTRKAADRLYRTGEEMRDELQKGMDEAKENIQRMTE